MKFMQTFPLPLKPSRLEEDKFKNFVFDLQRFDGEKTEKPTAKRRVNLQGNVINDSAVLFSLPGRDV